ncbi:MAG: hypothetical protein CMQ24_07130, partial [Gammaproteobacteria bacterium]|nr:hypothetical protein [Gammaproteobacteria bacterium]
HSASRDRADELLRLVARRIENVRLPRGHRRPAGGGRLQRVPAWRDAGESPRRPADGLRRHCRTGCPRFGRGATRGSRGRGLRSRAICTGNAPHDRGTRPAHGTEHEHRRHAPVDRRRRHDHSQSGLPPPGNGGSASKPHSRPARSRCSISRSALWTTAPCSRTRRSHVFGTATASSQPAHSSPFPFAERFDLAGELDILIASALFADLPEDVPAILNLSSHSIVDPAFGVWPTDALQASSIPRDRLIIEFPELALQVDRDRTADLMRMAVAAGYRISIDHVGTSSTTFEYLGQLPLSFAKVDCKYVHGLTDSAENRLLLTTLVQLARTRNIVLIAEGVETRQERAGLLDAGVHFGLGFLLGEPGSDRMS